MTDPDLDVLSARKWELQSADQWLADRKRMNSESTQFAFGFVEAVARFFARAVGDDAALAGAVIAQLGPTLSKCDELDFGHFPQALAYMLWHEVDRYYRVTQALDLLFERGVLPIAKPHRQLRLLEVGSGPAPASYATADYYAALGSWSEKQPAGFASSGSVEVHTLDRGPAWTQLIHQLSEELLVVGRSGPKRSNAAPSTFFNVTYSDLRGFDPRRLHIKARDEYRRRISESSWGEDDESSHDFDPVLDLPDPDSTDIQSARLAPPSAYDLIIVANFVTTDRMLRALEPDLATLARSLVPGGVLLTLSASGDKYQELWGRFSGLAETWRLDHVVNQVLQAHGDAAIHAQVAGATVRGLRLLRALAPSAFGAAELPPEVRVEVDTALTVPANAPIADAASNFAQYPKFQVHAFKRGTRAIAASERRRIAKRRAR